jgi:hypothetical protein
MRWIWRGLSWPPLQEICSFARDFDKALKPLANFWGAKPGAAPGKMTSRKVGHCSRKTGVWPWQNETTPGKLQAGKLKFKLRQEHMGVAESADHLFTFSLFYCLIFIFLLKQIHTTHVIFPSFFCIHWFGGPYKYTHYNILFYHLLSLRSPKNTSPKLIKLTILPSSFL